MPDNKNKDYENLGGVYDFDDYYDEGYESDYENGGNYADSPYGEAPYEPQQGSQGQRQQSPQRQRQGAQPRRRPSGGGSHQQGGGSRSQRPARKPQKQKSRYDDYKSPYDADTKTKKSSRPYSKKKTHPVRNAIRIALLIIVVLALIFNLMLWHYCGLVEHIEGGKRSKTDASMTSSDVRNILIIGSDTRTVEERGRTDSMILLSINSKRKEIVMTSFMRDMYVNIKGFNADGESIDTWGKMNSAYVYGGAELLMDTIEYNFDIQVDDYVYIDFYSFVDIVDAIGGIDMEITDEEAEGMIPPMAEQNKIMELPKGTDYLDHGGKLHLNGNQALAYARLRYVGNADFERTSRQREVISKIIETVKSSGPFTMMDFAKTSAKSLRSNMSRWQLFGLCYKALFSMKYKTVSLRLPDDESFSYGTTDDGQSVLTVDFDKCQALLREKIYS